MAPETSNNDTFINVKYCHWIQQAFLSTAIFFIFKQRLQNKSDHRLTHVHRCSRGYDLTLWLPLKSSQYLIKSSGLSLNKIIRHLPGKNRMVLARKENQVWGS